MSTPIEPEPLVPKRYAEKKKSSLLSRRLRSSEHSRHPPEIFKDHSETLSELHAIKALRLRRTSASGVNTSQLNRNTKRNYFMPKPVEVAEYALIYIKLLKCFNQARRTKADHPILRSRYAVFIAHIAVEMANILSHNLAIYETYDQSKIITKFERKHKNKVITRNLAKLLSMLENIEVNADKIPNMFEDLDIITNKDIVEKLKFILENFKRLSKLVTCFANKFYKHTDVFFISTELEFKFRFVSTAEMTLQFKSFRRSVKRVTEFYLLIKNVSDAMEKQVRIIQTQQLLEILNAQDMTFINTTILSNVKNYDDRLVVNHRVSIPGYCQILGNAPLIRTHPDILTHIEFQILNIIK